MNRVILIIVIFLVLFWTSIILLKLNQNNPQIIKQDRFDTKKEHQIYQRIELNKNSFDEFYCDNLRIKFTNKPNLLKLKGYIAYDKINNNFRLNISSLFGEELDIGLNDKYIWYWSKRDKKPALYWSKKEDFHLTRLKTPFDPFFFCNSLGLDIVDNEQYDLSEYENKILAKQNRINGLNQKVIYCFVFDKKSEQFEGLKIFDQNNKILAESIIKRNGFLPKSIQYIWYEENYGMTLTFYSFSTIIDGRNKVFDMPEKNIKIDMTKD